MGSLSPYLIVALGFMGLWIAKMVFDGSIKSLWRRFFPVPEPPSDETRRALQRAEGRLSTSHPNALGPAGTTFLDREANRVLLLRSTYSGARPLEPENLDLRGIDGGPTVPRDIAVSLLALFAEEVERGSADGRSGRALDHDLATQRIAGGVEALQSGVDGIVALLADVRGGSAESFDNLETSIRELIAHVDGDAHEIASQLRSDLDHVSQARDGLLLDDALSGIGELLRQIDGYRRFNPRVAGKLAGVRQVTLALKADVLTAAARVPERDAVVAALKEDGAIAREAAGGVALLAADLGDADWLAALLPQVPMGDRRRPFLRAALPWARHDIDGTLAATDTLGEPDLEILRVSALVSGLNPERATEAARLLDNLDRPIEGVTARKHLIVAERSRALLRAAVDAGIGSPDLDLKVLIRSTRRRYDEAIEVLGRTAERNPDDLYEAISGKSMFLEFIQERWAAEKLNETLDAMRGGDSPGLDSAIFRLHELATPGAIERLAQSGESHARLQIGRAYQAKDEGRRDDAEVLLRSAVMESRTPGEAARALPHLVAFLLASDRAEDAKEYLDNKYPEGRDTYPLPPDELATQRVIVEEVLNGQDAARALLGELILAYPKSRRLLGRKHMAALSDLKLAIEESDSDAHAIQAAVEAVAEVAQKLYDIVPAPYYKYLQFVGYRIAGRHDLAALKLKEVYDEGMEGIKADGLPEGFSWSNVYRRVAARLPDEPK